MGKEKEITTIKLYSTHDMLPALLQHIQYNLNATNNKYKGKEIRIEYTLDLSTLFDDDRDNNYFNLMSIHALLKDCNVRIIVGNVINDFIVSVIDIFHDAKFELPNRFMCRILSGVLALRTIYDKDTKLSPVMTRNIIGNYATKYKELFAKMIDLSIPEFEKAVSSGVLPDGNNFRANKAIDYIEMHNAKIVEDKIYKPVNFTGVSVSAEHAYIANAFLHLPIMKSVYRDVLDGNYDNDYPITIFYNTRGGENRFLESEVDSIVQLSKIRNINIICGSVASLGVVIISRIMQLIADGTIDKNRVSIHTLDISIFVIHKPLMQIDRGNMMFEPISATDDFKETGTKYVKEAMFSTLGEVLSASDSEDYDHGLDVVLGPDKLRKIFTPYR